MPLPDVAAPISTVQALPVPAVVAGWGGIGGARAQVLRPADLSGFRSALSAHSTGAIARGMGRSYGDAAQLEGGLILDTTLLKGFELDPSSGTVDAQAGITIGELLHALVPAGWMVPVVPGTQHVTVGGAIASDIHGKNHGTAGTFGSYVRALSLLSASGEVLELERGSDGGLFEATLGGMGLTGVILSARIQLRPVSSPLLAVDTDRVKGLDEALAALSEPGGPHRVAWLDLLGSRPGRGIVTRADHLTAADAPPQARGRATVAARATVPARWPAGALRPSTIRAFNELRFRSAPRRQRGHVEEIGSHMFPLDALESWPRLYGPRGFVQYQLVVPPGSEENLRSVIAHLRRARVPCYLAVLKDFGPANGAPLSFPVSGWTLALDLPRAVPGLEAALRRCDELVVQAGGRVYLTKDSRLRPEMVRAMYPRLEEWQSVREAADPDGVWRSDLAIRTGLIEPQDR
jgi:decaprenylphospho-beta-D-ribofuranose 2-oxidase